MLVVLYWMFALVFLLTVSGLFSSDLIRKFPACVEISSSIGFAILLFALGGTTPGRGPVGYFEPHSTTINERLDERDIRLRNAAHYEAYHVLRSFILPLSIIAFLWLETILERYKKIGAPVAALAVLVVYNLPQTLILWWEPDIEEHS